MHKLIFVQDSQFCQQKNVFQWTFQLKKKIHECTLSRSRIEVSPRNWRLNLLFPVYDILSQVVVSDPFERVVFRHRDDVAWQRLCARPCSVRFKR